MRKASTYLPWSKATGSALLIGVPTYLWAWMLASLLRARSRLENASRILAGDSLRFPRMGRPVFGFDGIAQGIPDIHRSMPFRRASLGFSQRVCSVGTGLRAVRRRTGSRISHMAEGQEPIRLAEKGLVGIRSRLRTFGTWRSGRNRPSSPFAHLPISLHDRWSHPLPHRQRQAGPHTARLGGSRQ